MKKLPLLFIALLTTSLLSAQESKTETLPLESIISIINRSLDKASDQLDEEDLKIKSAVISLKTTYNKSGGGGFNIILKASKKWQLENANTFTFSYTRDSLINKSGQSVENSYITEENLTGAVVQAATQWINATEMIKGLSKDGFSVEISVIVKKKTGSGFEFEIWDAGIDLSGEVENSAVHTIELTFE